MPRQPAHKKTMPRDMMRASASGMPTMRHMTPPLLFTPGRQVRASRAAAGRFLSYASSMPTL